MMMRNLLILAVLVLTGCASLPDQQMLQGSAVLNSGAPLNAPMQLSVSARSGDMLVANQTQMISFLPAYYSLNVPVASSDIRLIGEIRDQQGNVRYRSSAQPLSDTSIRLDEVLSTEDAAIRHFDCQGVAVRYTAQTGQPTLYVQSQTGQGQIELLTPTIGDNGIRYQGERYQFELLEQGARLFKDGIWLDCKRR
ncbi:hypothetical protein [Salinibius halmophilus]|uniref:hypothetical protein n=1 Tax=Salinibius halmophilus TaxID=1853216 RepID=UPI001314B170|nr:hypothetical protein [Salinibius halmophilus]